MIHRLFFKLNALRLPFIERLLLRCGLKYWKNFVDVGNGSAVYLDVGFSHNLVLHLGVLSRDWDGSHNLVLRLGVLGRDWNGSGRDWNGSDWATKGWRYSVNYKYSPFVVLLTNLTVEGCAVDPMEQFPAVSCSADTTSSLAQLEGCAVDPLEQFAAVSCSADTASSASLSKLAELSEDQKALSASLLVQKTWISLL